MDALYAGVARPQTAELQGAILATCSLRAQLTLQRQEDPCHRLFAPELGGGAMLDLGIYPLAFADMMLGVPVALNGLRRNASTGVDDLFAFNAQYPNGAIAQML